MTVLYLFDIDGTLVHAGGCGRAAFDAVMLELHGVADASNGIRYGGKTDHALIDEIFEARLGRIASEAERVQFLDAYIPRLHGLLATRGIQILDGVVDALHYLHRQPVRLGVATGNIRAGAEAKLGAAGLTAWFDCGGYGCDSRIRSELVARAIERGREGREVREVVVVGDTIHDITAARACGATVVAVATGTDAADLLGDADVVLRSMTELPAWHAARYA